MNQARIVPREGDAAIVSYLADRVTATVTQVSADGRQVEVLTATDELVRFRLSAASATFIAAHGTARLHLLGQPAFDVRRSG